MKKLLPLALVFVSMTATATKIQEDSEQRYFLGLSDPALKKLAGELLVVNAELASKKEAFFDTTAESVCQLGANAPYVLSGLSEKQLAETQRAMKQGFNVTSTRHFDSARLLSGQCDKGLPSGSFTALVRSTATTSHPDIPQPRRYGLISQVSGTLVNGRLEGPLRTYELMTDLDNPDGPYGKTPIAHIVFHHDNRPQELSLTAAGQSVLLRREILTSYGKQSFVKMYTGGTLLSEAQQLNGVPHGESLMYMGRREMRNCYQFGKIVPMNQCTDFKLPPSLLSKLSQRELDGLARPDNAGRFISPYTSDDVLAEWVNSLIVINLGSAIGKMAGGIAGAAASGMLDFIPYGLGGVLSASIAGKFGENLGTQQAINAVGGIEKMRAGTDVSFDSLNDMALYLSAKYGDRTTFKDAIKAATAIYPDLGNAIKRVK